MIISFFEEFPTKQNLDKIKLINFPTKLYIATKTIKELNEIKEKIKSKYIKEIIWWPILTKEEGYYFSPFASKKAMNKILQIKNQKIMVDLEMPINKLEMLTKFYKIITNRKILNKILKNKNIILCEHIWDSFLMKILGLNHPKDNKIKMLYTSQLILPRKTIENLVEKLSKKYSNVKIGLGLIAHGVEKMKRPLLTPEQLKQDLELCKEHSIKEVIIFRIGGLNKDYISIIENFIL